MGGAERRHIVKPRRGVTLKVGKKPRQRPKGFTDEEACAVLGAALGYAVAPQEHRKIAAAKRGAPWLCAYTGARIGEIVQLRRQDVRREGQHWTITITPEVGPVKNKEMREVPLHPHLVELGFPAFAEGQAEGYLFVVPATRGDVLGRLQGLKNRISAFVRTIVTDKRVPPNHGWRHRFVTVGTDTDISERVLNAICGHAPRNVAQRYGGVTLKAKADAIRRFPRYRIDQPKHVEAA
jgi:integrase